MAKRKSLSSATQGPATNTVPIPPPNFDYHPAPAPKRRASQRRVSQPKPDTGSTNPDKNANVLDGPEALRASPDATEQDERMNLEGAGMDVGKQVKEEENDSPLSEIFDIEPPVEMKKGKSKGKPVAASRKETEGQVETQDPGRCEEYKRTDERATILRSRGRRG